ncbi:hypothetical protein OWC48_44310 [Bradyrhizobium sp. Arg816]|nr:hypothetical protein [Bradyrhizobium sp. Arg816]MDI3567392.1 hypothetical protein [Bradyrhizobium sp. Arg816]
MQDDVQFVAASIALAFACMQGLIRISSKVNNEFERPRSVFL